MKLYTLYINHKRVCSHAYPFYTAVAVFSNRLIRAMEQGCIAQLRKVKR